MSPGAKTELSEPDPLAFEANRKKCLREQTRLREIMQNGDRFPEAIELFMVQHARLHSARVSLAEPDFPRVWSYEDELLHGVNEVHIRQLPPKKEHSIAWCIWHIARIEDVAMNLLVAGGAQVFTLGNWQKRMQVNIVHTGNEMGFNEVKDLSAKVDVSALRAYRVAVGQRTREIVKGLSPQDLVCKVDPGRLQRVLDESAVTQAAFGVVEYWSRRTIAGLLLMPATRHSLVHLNEALNLKGVVSQ
jgi:hypothetical protein